MERLKGMQWIMLGAVFVLLLTGCFGANETSHSIDPPQMSFGEEEWELTDTTRDETNATMQVTLYFEDADGFIAPVTIQLPETVSVARQALEFMVEGGPVDSMLPADFRALIPTGTEVLGLDIIQDKKLAIVDFSEHFTSYNVQDERKLLESITWALTGFPTIDQVQIWVEGKLLKEMPMAGTPLDDPLSRSMGINIEKDSGVHFSQVMPVTLYFLNQTHDLTYYVPVTRLVHQNDNAAMSAVEALISGPDERSGLASVILPDVQVMQMTQADDLITVNLSEEAFGIENKVPSETLQALVLSLTETTGIPRVQFMVNGEAQVSGTDNLDYSVPVDRPNYLNPFEL